MKLLAGFIAVITGFTTQETLEGKDYGLVEDSCEEYFHNAKSWPLTDKYPGAIRLCQNIAGKPHKFATLYDIPTGIPVYSAYIGNRSPDKTHHDRPDSRKRWPRLAKSLCFDGDFDSEKSYASRIDHVYHSDWAFCGKHQTVNDDYLGEHDLIHIDRGHVDPNEINNEDPDAQDTTFTLTNVAPQASIFNEHSWREYECMAREFMMAEHPGKDHYIMSGTHGTLDWMHGKMHEVRVPEYYWKAQCYDDGKSAWAWAIIIKNTNAHESADESSGIEVMTVVELSSRYLGGLIFDSVCQNASLGPWKEVRENWSNWQSKLVCHFPSHEEEDDSVETNDDGKLRFIPRAHPPQL